MLKLCTAALPNDDGSALRVYVMGPGLRVRPGVFTAGADIVTGFYLFGVLSLFFL